MRRLVPVIMLLVMMFLATAGTVEAALTTPKCHVLKRKAWSTLRKCEAAEDVKQLAAKPADRAKCTTRFQGTMAKIDAKAVKAGIACRFRDNGDGTVTDFDTGLMWEKKIETILTVPCGFFPPGPLRCVTRDFTWAEAMSQFLSELNGAFDVATSAQAGHAGHTDWRVPTYPEVLTILDVDVPGCNTGGACIDPTFGPTAVRSHWSSTTSAADPNEAHVGDFSEGDTPDISKDAAIAVRAVRRDL
jgi:hypothetical protein